MPNKPVHKGEDKPCIIKAVKCLPPTAKEKQKKNLTVCP